MIDKRLFFNGIRGPGKLFARLSTAQVAGIERIIDVWFSIPRPGSDLRWLACVLGNVQHETGSRMQPVRETFASSDAQAIARLDAAYQAGRLAGVTNAYWRKDSDGKAWFGRGDIQITHKANYLRMSPIVGVDLVKDPSAALDPIVSAKIAIEGMIRGSFRGKKLADYFPAGGAARWKDSRAIVNGDVARNGELVAGYCRAYYEALKVAERPGTEPPPPDFAPPEPRSVPEPAPAKTGLLRRLLNLILKVLGRKMS